MIFTFENLFSKNFSKLNLTKEIFDISTKKIDSKERMTLSFERFDES
jgi:hypothetical protein